jgi:hypothetical protein
VRTGCWGGDAAAEEDGVEDGIEGLAAVWAGTEDGVGCAADVSDVARAEKADGGEEGLVSGPGRPRSRRP